MLDSFFVENFRLFRRLEIARLGRVNLLVGKNNSGKSALLEAVELYASNASLATLQSLVLGRDEAWNERNSSKEPLPSKNSVRHLFRGHQLPGIGEQGIALGTGEDKTQALQIRVAAYQMETYADGITRRITLTAQEAEEAEYAVEIAVIVQDKDTVRRVIKLDSTTDNPWIRPRSLPEVTPKNTCQIVPTHNMTPYKIATLWDLVGLTDAESEVIAGLKLIAPSIIGVGFVENETGSGQARVPLVRTTDAPEPLPLKSMGDGMTRLFHIIVALVNAKNGILLIDEFENGLHWSVQSAVWKTVFRLAADLNVQVFATTHSRDCVASFEEAWKDSPEEGAFFRLQINKEGDSVARAYTLETLMDSLETDVEVR